MFVCQQERCSREEETDDVKEKEDSGWSEVPGEMRSDGIQDRGRVINLDESVDSLSIVTGGKLEYVTVTSICFMRLGYYSTFLCLNSSSKMEKVILTSWGRGCED